MQRSSCLMKVYIIATSSFYLKKSYAHEGGLCIDSSRIDGSRSIINKFHKSRRSYVSEAIAMTRRLALGGEVKASPVTHVFYFKGN